MTEPENKKKEKQPKTSPKNPVVERGPWISMKSALRIITAVSILMAALTAWSVVPVKGWGQGILYGLLFGVLIWVVFFVMQVFFRWLRR
ncbi:MAG: hypothetical protein M1281_05490 [Chloroflexi bacterium]|nr:hypothetical protein [Chloroflexota bacterium]